MLLRQGRVGRTCRRGVPGGAEPTGRNERGLPQAMNQHLPQCQKINGRLLSGFCYFSRCGSGIEKELKTYHVYPLRVYLHFGAQGSCATLVFMIHHAGCAADRRKGIEQSRLLRNKGSGSNGRQTETRQVPIHEAWKTPSCSSNLRGSVSALWNDVVQTSGGERG